MGKRTYYLYDGDQVVCEIAGANSSVAAGGVYGAYAYGPWGMTARWSGTTAEYTSFTWDPFGNPVMRHRQTVVNPADICVYDSRGFIIADKNTSAAGTLPVVDPNGGLGQYGDQTDEELKGTGLASGLQLLTGGGYYDPTAGRYVNRFADIENEYKAAMLPWRVFGGIGEGFAMAALDSELEGVEGSEQIRAKARQAIRSGSKIDRAAKGMGFVLFGGVKMYSMGRPSGMKLDLSKPKAKAWPLNKHHIATNKHQFWTPRLKRIADKYGLDLDGTWNKVTMRHRGPHPREYHEWVEQMMERADAEAAGDRQRFIQLFKKYLEEPLVQDPRMLNWRYWRK